MVKAFEGVSEMPQRAAAAAGLLGPPIDVIRSVVPVLGYGVVLIAALAAFIAALGVTRALLPAVQAAPPVVATLPREGQ